MQVQDLVKDSPLALYNKNYPCKLLFSDYVFIIHLIGFKEMLP